jgi:mono/diheme cytochrome c family protein
VLSALATSHKVGIAAVAGVFILFAFACSFLLPAIWPGFPGKHVRLFVVVCVLITAGMLASVIALAGEPKEERAAAGEATTAPAAPAAPSKPAPAAPAGDATAGKALFNQQGCGSCHTFQPAGSNGKVGPDLDHLAADAAKANQGSVTQYATESIKNPAAYVVPGYPSGVMPKFTLTDKQVADLVAFLTSGS